MSSYAMEILELGHPTLRQLAAPVGDITSVNTQQILDELLQFAQQKKGMGIAAPQVGISQQIFIMCSHPNDRYPQAPTMPPTCVLNPTIISHSTTHSKDWEGCLSIPGIRALVPRYEAIDVVYQQRDGQRIEAHFSGFLARLFQHEYDHLQGKLFIDRAESTLEIMTEKHWRSSILNQH